MLRILSLCLVILLSIGIVIPFANSAHGVRQRTQVGKSANRRHSKAWWRRYRARMRRKRAAALARRQMLFALPKSLPAGVVATNTAPVVLEPAVTTQQAPATVNAQVATASTPATAPVAPTVATSTATASTATASTATASTATAPTAAAPTVASAHSVSNLPTNQPVMSATSNASLKSKTKNSAIQVPGQMNLAVVAMSRPNPAFLTSREAAKMLAGVDVAELRRIVIDKMIGNGGWVTNDFVREVGGGRVFVVTAQTPQDARSPEKVWTFYFTEVDGRIYSLTTDSAIENSQKMGAEAERFITNLRSNPQTIKK